MTDHHDQPKTSATISFNGGEPIHVHDFTATLDRISGEGVLSNPAPDDPYAQLRGVDGEHLGDLDPQTRELVREAREELAAHAVTYSGRAASTFKTEFSLPFEGVPVTCAISITLSPEDHTCSPRGVALFFQKLHGFEGAPEQLADTIALAMVLALYARKAQVQVSYQLWGVNASVKAKHER